MSCGWQVSVQMQWLVWVLWLIGLGLILLACAGALDHPYAPLGGAFVALGCMTQVGTWLRQHAKDYREAFDLGRESALRSIRR